MANGTGQEPGLLQELWNNGLEVLAALVAPLVAWLAYKWGKYRRDGAKLTRLEHERREYKERFGVSLIEHTQAMLDSLTMLVEGQERCDNIHSGLGDDETARIIVRDLRAEIKAVDDKVEARNAEEVEYKRQIASDMSWIRGRLEE